MLDVYKLVIQMFPSYTSSSASNVKQEILLGLGDLYTQAHMMFNVDMYLQLLGILHLAIRSSRNSSNVEREAYPDAYGDIATSHLNQIVWRKLLPVIVKLNLEASPTETFSVSAEVFHGLGRNNITCLVGGARSISNVSGYAEASCDVAEISDCLSYRGVVVEISSDRDSSGA
ncbi:uncharacterized protein LOC121997482 isoform X3 [Zingiber officinale]|uniref:uncharacterized protein LOC121997482 isoform X3 n=1 Tax=Zingiber officinale TaxID=94328 RepID=UPI001C4BE372|nr:uncharacterized protein LOC121997482 isoform X3 [Zingiber officinale]